MSTKARARLQLLIVASLFLAPVVGAIALFFYFPEYIPAGRVNYGEMVSPARALPPLNLLDEAGAPKPETLLDKWTLVVVANEQCGESCKAQLIVTRQVRTAQNQHRGRVRRVYVAPTRAALEAARADLAGEHPDLVFVAEESGTAARFFGDTGESRVYLLDPLGNWLMSYPHPIEPRGLHRDLKKLLKISQVG
ncbi:MAG TPA: hypothetical protein VM240_14580 [Verrucomicrobiae bacterium]|nr:hypothetical protein [Verrucomicrobiae bacterium]